ncbi:prephenate dehydratase [Exophiala dermatitidis]|uniref:Chorismate mutase/prephenate dehydratase n=2 Tax=Exophiala dermatitidis TaxID=5970 RepID=H6BYA1_EXODN|nr:chorismate mutase/prephenate dehydratase [Exophiala dermatitidis NIH/UT8656]KAJ4520269.1 prephenate dehydratase [Exophiala dermatitidis]EHY56669.1 chorismate mutase/prephenate dehydratase [Exophiala dermatitidis NIH/UT8656]KAJ4524126.1 prephenate dehydratase [Exophiala dermatitidis]KAJ4525602.1 prephenate dehydratase [Exophiala dermatitidis]KAJ4536919.1 prephenate dehydratase [Exophiala dermatitidis]
MLEENGTPLAVAYLGPEASFSHQAAIGVFGPTTSTSTPSSSSASAFASTGSKTPVSLHPLPSFSAIFSAIQNSSSSSSGSAATSEKKEQEQPEYDFDFAVIPIENSTNGSVVQVLDLLAQCGHETEPEPESESTALPSPSSAPAAATTARPALYPDVEVCAEYYLPVHHCLFVAPSSVAEHNGYNTNSNSSKTDIKNSIRTLYTHPQVWGQCGRYLGTHFPPAGVERIDVGSTSAAAQLVAREGAATKKSQSTSSPTSHSHSNSIDPAPGISAAIASKLAGEKHNLICLAENIEDEPGSNTTRFFVVRNRNRHRNRTSQRQQQLPEQSHTHTRQHYYKSLITFTIDHTRPGSLADALAVFKQYSFNLTSIDTRPSRKRNWQYVFFVECETTHPEPAPAPAPGHKDQNLTNMLRDLRKFTESLRYLGRFEDQLRSQ